VINEFVLEFMRKIRRILVAATGFAMLGCTEDVRPIAVTQSPSGQVVAVLERSSGLGAWDSYVYDAYVKPYAADKIYVAVFRAPRNNENEEGVDFIWRGENSLIIRFSAAAEAKLTREVVNFPGQSIRIAIEGPV
jgi:hypothetical protein